MPETQGKKRSLYLKWRPSRFQEVVGQEGPVRILQNSVKKGETSHANLFAGPRGTGKTSVARILAKAINCENSQDGEPCNECTSCKKIERGTVLDIVEIDGASNRGIDKIRELREEVNFAPAELQNKVYIIDEVHMLTTQAFNALLKTIEEPPDRVTFIFATTEPEKVPATIISRCQVFEFTEIARSEIKGRLWEVASSEGVEITEEALNLISSRARGSMRDGLVVLEQIISYDPAGKVKKDDLFELLGLTRGEVVEEYTESLITGRPGKALEVLDELEKRGKDPELFLDQVLEKLRTQIKHTEDRSDLQKLVKLSRGILDSSDDLKSSTHKRVTLEIGTLELLEEMNAGETGSTREPEPEEVPGTSRETPPQEVDGSSMPAEEIQNESDSSSKDSVGEPHDMEGEKSGRDLRGSDRWKNMIERIEEEKISIAAFLEEAHPVFRNQDLYLEFGREYSFHKESLEKKRNFSYLREAVQDCFDDVDELRIIYNEREDRTESEENTGLLDEKAELVKDKFDGNVVEEGRL
ncbi:DNA polymerase III subunit gamma/tau [Candidatus Bipolaricaulota bacterium]|nr:DNA polymerase III subunit gamma/tau [Candidatus Bipolaricaulota bacterium]